MYSYHLIYKGNEEEAEKEYQLLLKTAKTHPVKQRVPWNLRSQEE